MAHQATCQIGKQRYFSFREAAAALQRLLAVGREHPARLKRLRVYRCRQCGAYHLGHNFGLRTEWTARRGKHRRLRRDSKADG